MRLTTKQIESCAAGVISVTEEAGLVTLHRFTREQEQMYVERSSAYTVRSRATANVMLEFDTDSPSLELELSLIPGSGRKIYNHSIYTNGVRIGEIAGSLEQEELAVSGRFDLGAGEKRVKIYFPWSVGSRIRSLKLAEGASFVPVTGSGRKMLLFGDSITQGYTALRPENSYAVRLAEHLGLEGINKGIGGEVFRPSLALLKDPFSPECITVAYGTNDWSKLTWDEFEKNSREFLENLRKTYPDVPIYVFAPLWRESCMEITAVGAFKDVAKHLEQMAGKIGAKFVDCFSFLQADMGAMADRVHPNDEGFRLYLEGLREVL